MGQKFNPGDLVELKSGGPAMTVEKVSTFEGNSYSCSWFAGDRHHSQWFEEQALKSYKEED